MITALDAPDAALDAHERNFVSNIRKHGWVGTGVAAEAGFAGFSYTTGFWVTLGVPEIIVFSLSRETAHAVLWDLFNEMKAGKRQPVRAPTRVFGNSDGVFFPVNRQRYADHLGWSRWFYGNDDFPCWQLVWPDKDGRFPWQPGVDEAVRADQPDLSAGGWAAEFGTAH